MHRVSEELVLDHSTAALAFVDPEGFVTYANEAAMRLLGWQGKSLKGINFYSEFCPDNHNHSVLRRHECSFQLIVDGIPRFLKCVFVPNHGENSPANGYLATITDVTELRLLTEERDRLMEMATISELMPTIMHEFKNPLASIQALVELITLDCTDPQLQDQLYSILQEIRRMKLGFEGLGATSRQLASSRHHAIDASIREACHIFQRQLKARKVTLKANIETMPLLPFNAGSIRGVLFNLLNNAKQATRPGDTITVSAGLIDQDQTLFFSVKDTGPGMPAEILAQCTNLFFTTKKLGSGIGLALCKSAVEKINGQLSVWSEPGEGTEISVRLPFKS